MQSKIEFFRSYLFIALGFLIPFSTAGISILAAFIVILWVLDRNYAKKIEMHSDNPVYLAIFAFFILHVVGLLWTEQPINGFKNWLVFLVPLLATAVPREYAIKGVYAFVTGMMVSEVYVYFGIFQNWETWLSGAYKIKYLGPDHISYNPMLAMSVAVVLTTLLAGCYQGWKKWLTIFFFLTMTANMFMTGGRAGQVGFIFIWIVLSIYFLYKRPIALTGMFASLVLVLALAFNYSPIFNKRATEAVDQFLTYDAQSVVNNDPISVRLVFAEYSFKLFTEEPWFGHGTGSFENAYKEYWERGGVPLSPTSNPHNNHLLILVQFGLVGFLFYAAIFWTQLLQFRKMPDKYEFKAVAFVLPLFFILISMYDSYLWGHHTQAMFAYFASILYREDVFRSDIA